MPENEDSKPSEEFLSNNPRPKGTQPEDITEENTAPKYNIVQTGGKRRSKKAGKKTSKKKGKKSRKSKKRTNRKTRRH